MILSQLMERLPERYTLVEQSDGRLTITIPQRKQWVVILFLGGWLSGWVISDYYVLRALTGFGGGITSFFQWLFFVVWFGGWTYGGFLAIQALVWNVVGQSIIVIGNGQLVLYQKGYFGATPGVYDLKAVKQFSVREPTPMDIDSPGRLTFTYGVQTIEFGNELSDWDARAIVARLKTAGVLTDEHW